MLLKLGQFGGSLPLRNKRNTPDVNAVYAENIRIDQGGMRPTHPSQPILSDRFRGIISNGPNSILRVYGVVRDRLQRPDLVNNMMYMGFGDPDTDIARTPFVNDRFDRHYYCSPKTGLRVVTRDQIEAYAKGTRNGVDTYQISEPISGFKVGVPAPPVEPKFVAKEDTAQGALVWIDAGDTPIPHKAGEPVTDPQYRFYPDPVTGLSMTQYQETPVTRAYTITYVNAYGEESQPGATVEVDVAADQDVLLSALPVPVDVPGYPPYTKKRIYRTVVEPDGTAPYFRVADIDLAVTDYRDALKDIAITGNDVLPSIAWTLPPEGLQGIIAMPTGYMVGFIGRDLYFSEAYRPHAWPDKYVITVEHDIVGLGVTAGTLVVLTAGKPVLISGARPDLVQQDATAQSMPCLSRGSIVSTPQGVIFASDNGWILFGQGGLQRFSDEVIGPQAWRRDFIPYSIRAIMLPDGTLVFSHTDATGKTVCDAMRPDAPPLGLVRHSFLSTFSPILMTEVNTGRALIIVDNGVAGAAGSLDEFLPAYVPNAANVFTWRSKEFQVPSYGNFGAVRIDWDSSFGGIGMRLWAILRNDDTEERIKIFDQYEAFEVSGKPVRLPSGCRYDTFQVELFGTTNVYGVQLASTVTELRNA